MEDRRSYVRATLNARAALKHRLHPRCSRRSSLVQHPVGAGRRLYDDGDDVRYGFSDEDWAAAKQEMVAKLIERAKVRGMIPYSELVRDVKTIRLEPDSHALAAMLGEISEAEDRAGRSMLTVIVVHKHGDMQPGPGFFELARSLGRDTQDILRCWVDELKKVHGYWSR